MSRLTTIALLLALLAAPARAEDHAAAVEALTSTDAAARERAEKTLRTAGAAALPALRVAILGDDLPLAARAMIVAELIALDAGPAPEPRRGTNGNPGGVAPGTTVQLAIGGVLHTVTIAEGGAVTVEAGGKRSRYASLAALKAAQPQLHELLAAALGQFGGAPAARPRVRLGVWPGQSAQPGLLVDRLDAGGLAAKAGVAVGDRIVAIGGRAVRGLEDARAALAPLVPGKPFTLTVVRGEQRLTLRVGERPRPKQPKREYY